MLSEFKITSLRDSSFTTRLRHNRIQNRTEPVPLTEIYESEIRRLRAENEFLKMQSNANAIQQNAALAQLHKKCDIASFTLVFAFKQNNDDKRNKSHRKVWDLLSFLFILCGMTLMQRVVWKATFPKHTITKDLFSKCCLSDCALHKYACHKEQWK